jgi:hypothetical protein
VGKILGVGVVEGNSVGPKETVLAIVGETEGGTLSVNDGTTVGISVLGKTLGGGVVDGV